MSYQAPTQMASSNSLKDRIASCAAMEEIDDPYGWTSINIFKIVARSDWNDAWQYAEDNKTVNVNQDTGMRDDVISDSMILAAVQAVHNA